MKTTLNRMSNGILQTSDTLVRSRLEAVDGEVGTCEALYFDDVRWAVRYLLVDSSEWLAGRRTLVSPVAIGEVRPREQEIFVELTRIQIAHSPLPDPGRPISRPYEVAYFDYYRWPAYWSCEPLRRGAQSAADKGVESRPGSRADSTRTEGTCLHASNELIGASVVACDTAIGVVTDFVVDTRYWIIRYLLVEKVTPQDARLLPVSPEWIAQMNWLDRVAEVDIGPAAMDSAPTLRCASDIDRDYEARLHSHYGRPAYWRNEG
jgi:hypothetical protein